MTGLNRGINQRFTRYAKTIFTESLLKSAIFMPSEV
jgi:hypothetical protein